MEDLITLEQGYGIYAPNYRWQMGTGVGLPSYNRPAIIGSALSDIEKNFLLKDSEFNFGKRRKLFSKSGGKDAKTSDKLTLSGVSQSDYLDLLSLDLFRGGSVDDVTGTKIGKSSYQMNQAGQIARTSGEELSLLDAAGLERLAQVVSGRQSEILGRGLTPGLGVQSFSLFSGNF